jgi:hypothetical protein
MKKTKTKAERKVAEQEIGERYARLKDSLNERTRRLFAGAEALSFGFGGTAAVSRATGMSPKTVRKGIADSLALEQGTAAILPTTRSRRPGGGRRAP